VCVCVCVYGYPLLSIYVVYLYITLGTNNAYKNINLGRQTFNNKSVSLEIFTNATITVADFIYNTEIIGKSPFSLTQYKSPRANSPPPSWSTAALKSQTNHYLSDVSKSLLFDVVFSLCSHFFFFSTSSWFKQQLPGIIVTISY